MFKWTSPGKVKYKDEVYEHDVWIDVDQVLHERQSKDYLEALELTDYLTEDTIAVVIGTGQRGTLKITEEAMNLIIDRKLELHKYESPQAIKAWNDIANTRPTVAIIHVF